jgi:putative MFS transporter
MEMRDRGGPEGDLAVNRIEEGSRLTWFWCGSVAVTIGTLLHLPMYIRSAAMNFHLAGMPVDWSMVSGMLLIAAGTAAAWYGLLPLASMPALQPSNMAKVFGSSAEPAIREDGKLTGAHWQLIGVLSLGLAIDSMKPASLGFVIPGTAQEYGLSHEAVALFPFLALTGLTVGSYVWGMIADQIGRRAAILLSGIMFVGTAICGSMPAFEWNLLMCFFMGLAAGGMLPITYTLLAECMPSGQRGWVLVLVGGIGLLGGYFAASGCAAMLEPYFGWRIMWFLNAPTGIVLIFCNRLIPESPRFLMARGRYAEARALVARYDVPIDFRERSGAADPIEGRDKAAILLRHPFLTTTMTLNTVGLAWGLVNFGLLIWLPAELRARGFSISGSDVLLFQSALFSLPTTILVAFFYNWWSTK